MIFRGARLLFRSYLRDVEVGAPGEGLDRGRIEVAAREHTARLDRDRERNPARWPNLKVLRRWPEGTIALARGGSAPVGVWPVPLSLTPHDHGVLSRCPMHSLDDHEDDLGEVDLRIIRAERPGDGEIASGRQMSRGDFPVTHAPRLQFRYVPCRASRPRRSVARSAETRFPFLLYSSSPALRAATASGA